MVVLLCRCCRYCIHVERIAIQQLYTSNIHTPAIAAVTYPQETAINIGYACSLITDDMTQFQLTGSCAEVEMLEALGQVSVVVCVIGN